MSKRRQRRGRWAIVFITLAAPSRSCVGVDAGSLLPSAVGDGFGSGPSRVREADSDPVQRQYRRMAWRARLLPVWSTAPGMPSTTGTKSAITRLVWERRRERNYGCPGQNVIFFARWQSVVIYWLRLRLSYFMGVIASSFDRVPDKHKYNILADRIGLLIRSRLCYSVASVCLLSVTYVLWLNGAY